MSDENTIHFGSCPTCTSPVQMISRGHMTKYRPVQFDQPPQANVAVLDEDVERAAKDFFESYYADSDWLKIHPSHFAQLQRAMRATLESYASRHARKVPDGFVLVPEEAGDQDAFMVYDEYTRPAITRKDAYRIAIRKLADRAAYMLAASPKPGEG